MPACAVVRRPAWARTSAVLCPGVRVNCPPAWIQGQLKADTDREDFSPFFGQWMIFRFAYRHAFAMSSATMESEANECALRVSSLGGPLEDAARTVR